MRPVPRALLAAALVVAAASPALAQGALTFTLALEPSARAVSQGNATWTDVVVENQGVTNLRVDLSLGPTPLGATLARTSLSIAPGGVERVRLDVTTAGAPVGNHSVEVFAREPAATPPVQPQSTSITFYVNVLGAPATNGTQAGAGPAGGNGTLPDAATANGTDDARNATVPEATPVAPVLSAERLTLSAAPREVVPFWIDVENPGLGAQTFDVTLRLPLGWTGSLAQERVEVPAQGRATLEGSLMPLAGAGDGEAVLTVRGLAGSDEAVLALRALPAPPAEARSEEPGPAPSQDAPDAEPPRAAEPPPPLPGVVTLRLVPSQVRIPQGGSALARLVVVNGGGEPLDAPPRLLLPQGFLVDPGAPDARVAPGATVEVPLVLSASDDLPMGSEGRATAWLLGVDADAAPFSLLVVPPEPAGAPALPEPASSASWPLALALGAAGAAALAAAWAWRRRWHLPLFALYARLKPGRVLEHPTRRAIADLVAAEPGLRLGEVRRRLGLANGRVRHHVDRLESAGVLRSVPEGPHRRLYPSALGRVAPLPGLAERLLRAVEERGPVSMASLAASLGVSRQALHYHVKKLAAEGRLTARVVGKELVLAATRPDAPAGEAPRGAPAGPAR